ncbi:hypothetical protein BC938DRAFT_481653 [Jimgerdemannia flammicorona]|uniref:Uncharacterized protein n=1 Tax=Jimgerdemannia flammicorona TaxID=994334 RepID=A0A433QFS6_9FUNG|nr:hypothetical protein BC938DRAFT_481653 [Jimgerdemannia flammicorona]
MSSPTETHGDEIEVRLLDINYAAVELLVTKYYLCHAGIHKRRRGVYYCYVSLMDLFFVHQQPQIPTFEDFLNGIKLGACRDKLVSAGLDEEMFGEFVQCEESFIDEAIREYPLNITQKVVFKNGILKLRKSLGMYIHS